MRRRKLLSYLCSSVFIGGFSFLALLGIAVTAVEGASYFVELPAEHWNTEGQELQLVLLALLATQACIRPTAE